jgi:hypothetical protein
MKKKPQHMKLWILRDASEEYSLISSRKRPARYDRTLPLRYFCRSAFEYHTGLKLKIGESVEVTMKFTNKGKSE